MKVKEVLKRAGTAEAEVASCKRIIADLTDDAECLPGCDSDGHDTDCPVMSAANLCKSLRAELAAANKRLAALAKAYDAAPGLPLEAPGADLAGWTNVLIGFGHVLNDELNAIDARKG